MNSNNHLTDLQQFLIKHNKTGNDKEFIATHTRIPCQDLKIYGGAFHIEPTELELFHQLYYEYVFVKHNKEYLTEKQIENGPILVDFDFRYDTKIRERQHSQEHITDIIGIYLDEISKLLNIDNTSFPIFIMEKPNVNTTCDPQFTKDGIHMIIGIQMDHILQQMLRTKVLNAIKDNIDLPLKNDWEGVLDEGISKGCTNWQMYGSRKPGNEAYALTYYLTAQLDPNDGEFMTQSNKIESFNLSKNYKLLSAQYTNHFKFDINPNVLNEYNERKNNEDKLKFKKSPSKGKINLQVVNDDKIMDIQDIKNAADLQQAIDEMELTLKMQEYYIKEIHRYTQILPKKYYEPGSHLLNREVAFALKHTDERLFLSWIMLRSKASDFEYSTIPTLYNMWNTSFNKRPNGLTKRSIIYWAKQDAYDDYLKVKKSSIDYFIDITILDATEFDFATVLYYMYKDKYVCTSITAKRWYVFKNHRWELDEGQSLRMAISKNMWGVYQEKMDAYLVDLQNYLTDSDCYTKIQTKAKKIAEVSVKLKRTNDKNNIMREAMEIFFDKDFVKNMDSNKYLLCFSNGVIDFKTNTFRDGYPQDYVTKSTHIPYVPYDTNAQMSTINEINLFMDQLFPIKEVCNYMWDHLAASLIGVKKEHVFNIYRGSGSNGKSILTDLMSRTLGEYKGTVPITLVTEKRNNIGGTSSEIMQLKGIRYAVMQEPSKDAIINEGVMKELTGCDPIQGRALYSDSEIFEPQFSLVVCTNALFEIKSNDDGTWRRLKLVDFVSKFISEGETHTDDTKHVFPKDKMLKEKLSSWAVVFASMLVKKAFETAGEVKDCSNVVEASTKYRQTQDCISAFVIENVIVPPNDFNGTKSIGKRELNESFKNWFINIYGNRKMPKLLELDEYMVKKYGESRRIGGKWVNLIVKQEQYNDIDELNTN